MHLLTPGLDGGWGWVWSNPCGHLTVYAWRDIMRWRLLPLSLTASHTNTHANTSISSLALSLSLLPSPSSLSPTCTEVCVQTDCSKMAAAEPTGLCCAACPPPTPSHSTHLLGRALGVRAQAKKERCMCRVWIHASHRRGGDAMNPHWVLSDQPSRVAGEGLAVGSFQIAAHICLLGCKHICAVCKISGGGVFSDCSFCLEWDFVFFVRFFKPPKDQTSRLLSICSSHTEICLRL